MGIGLFYTLTLAVCGFIASGNGHGTEIVTDVFFVLALLPFPLLNLFPLPLFYWTIVSLLLCWARLKAVRTIAVCLVVIHYISIAVYLYKFADKQRDDFAAYWQRNSEFVIFIISFFLAGQLLIWWRLFSALDKQVVLKPAE